MEDEKGLIDQIAELRSVVEAGFIAMIAHQLHAVDRSRGIDHCIHTAVQTMQSAQSLIQDEADK